VNSSRNGRTPRKCTYHIFTNQLLVYADDVNLLGDNADNIKKSTETLIDASKEVGLEVNTEKPKYIAVSSQE
jgi:hypothetical protein